MAIQLESLINRMIKKLLKIGLLLFIINSFSQNKLKIRNNEKTNYNNRDGVCGE
jgi:hypothetical protein